MSPVASTASPTAASERGRHGGYLPALDGLRAVSITLVFLSHAGFGHIVPGGLGVTVFFFISGYIITRLLLIEHAAHGSVDVRRFYLRRFFRLMPALYVFVAASVLLTRLAGRSVPWPDVTAALFYFANYWNIAGHFDSGAAGSPLSITWSLAVEEHYYLVYPLLVTALAGQPRRMLAVLITVLAAVLAWRFWLAWDIGLDNLRPDRIYMATDTRLDSILYGAVCALLSTPGGAAADGPRPAWLAGEGGVRIFWLGLLLLGISLLYRDAVFRETLRYSLQGVALLCMTQHLVFGSGWLVRLLSSAPMRYLGAISYSLYLYHWLAHVLLRIWLPDAGPSTQLAGMVVLAWPAAHLSWRWIEHTGLAWRRRILGETA